MSIFTNILEALPEALLDLVPGGDILKPIARRITGADDDADAAVRLHDDKGKQLEYQKAVLEHIALMAKTDVERVQAENARLADINQTMRAETRSEHKWAALWRPFWGFCSAIAFVLVCGAVFWLAYRAIVRGDAAAMAMIPQLISMFAALFAIPGAILGIASYHRGKEKRFKAGEIGVDLIKDLGGQALGGQITGLAGQLFKRGDK